MQAHRQTRTLLIGIAILSWTAPSIALGEWYAGTWDSCYNPLLEHPRTVAIRMELLDKDTHIPVSDVQVSLEGEYYRMRISQDIATAKDVSWWNLFVDPNKREPRPKEFKLEAVSGSDGVVVFSLQWQKEFPWDTKIGDKWTDTVGDQWLLYVDDIEKVQRLEIRHPRYRYVEAPLNFQHVVGLKQYLDPQRVVADKYKLFEQNWQNEIGRRNVKLFVLDLGTGFPEYKKQFCTRPEFFSRIRAKEYGEVYQVLENRPNMDDGKKCGPYFVYDLGEILLEPITSRVEVEGVGTSILTQDTQGEGTPWYRQYSRQPDVADTGPREGLGQKQATVARPASDVVARQETDIAPVNTRTATAGGIVVQDLDAGKKKEIDRVMGHPVGIIGVEVVRVDPFCPACDAGLRSGMIITSIKREEAQRRGGSLSMPEFLVKTLTDANYFERLVAGFADGDSVTLMVWRQSEGNNIRPGYVGSEEKGKWYQGYISFRHEQVPSEAVAGASDSRTATVTDQQVQPATEDAKKLSAHSLPSLKKVLSDPAKLRDAVQKATAMKNQLAVTAIRALPMPDPDTGQMTTLDAYARKLAADTGVRGSLGEDPVATAYMILVDSNFLTDQARVIQLPDGKYATLNEAIGVASGAGSDLDPDVLERAVTVTTDLQQAQRAGNGELLSKALTKLFFVVSEANASRGGALIPATPTVAQDTGDGSRPAPPANGGRAPTGKTIDLGNGVSMEFVLIPPGSFSMGSPDSEKDSYGDEGPVRRVQITKAFYMGRYEVTQDQYMAVMGRNPSKFSGRNLPVETVSWEEAVAFCRKIGGRLPTEAEWEYACRAGSETQFCYGDDPNYAQLGEYAWYPGNSGSTIHAIGQKKPNSFGLYDMHGNVYEWCSDWFAAYANEQTVDPVGPPSGQSRVCRGGGWRRFARYCRSAARNHSSPGSGGGLIGFRVALDSN